MDGDETELMKWQLECQMHKNERDEIDEND
jgi:hypothetical protein